MAKSDLILAFNEIAELRKLPREVIIDALKAALVSAYRRNAGVSSAQLVEARVDERTGEPSVWVEREVVEEVQSIQTEVALADARRYDPNANLGDMVLVEDTPEDFGRIAAQTAKQVILQRMREAEREAQYQEYMDRVGDLVTGTVQSDSGDVVTVGLGRTEAILPRSQQVPGEHYRMHDKVRAYVMEVRRTNRGPQIVVSRTHRNMLRRLLEYEVPEIYNGTVDIKSIAREPGARSKVAVAALQPGADPVGACVGMRGVRIQSIVRELNNEKIDVIEWNPDDAIFISKSLSPARVSAVFLDDDPEGGRTAMVVVPDDQLSLAIGREGQNARLAAKLTGWRIDIKSVTEAAHDLYQTVGEDPLLAELVETHSDMIARVGAIIEKKALNKPIMPEDYNLLIDFIKLFEGKRAAELYAERQEVRQRLEAAREQVPTAAYDHPLEDTDLPLRVYNLLVGAGYGTVGEVVEVYHFDPDRLLSIDGFGPSALEHVARMVQSIDELAESEIADMPGAQAEDVIQMAPVPATEAAMEAALPVADAGEEGIDEDEYEARLRRAELVSKMALPGTQKQPEEGVAEPSGELVAEDIATVPEIEAAWEGAEEGLAVVTDEEEEEDLYEYDDMTVEEREELARRKAKQRRRQLVFDEDAGRVVARRRRKGGRKRSDWLGEWEEE